MEKKKNPIIEILKPIVLALFLAFIILSFIQPTIVRETSMLPNYRDGDYLITSKVAYAGSKEPQKGDVVIVKTKMEDKALLIKRVIATEGDYLEIKDGYVYLNGKKLNEPYLNEEGVTFPEDHSKYHLGEDMLFCMGDNREVSLDSRSSDIGFIDSDDVLGKAVIRLYPFNRFGVCR